MKSQVRPCHHRGTRVIPEGDFAGRKRTGRKPIVVQMSILGGKNQKRPRKKKKNRLPPWGKSPREANGKGTRGGVAGSEYLLHGKNRETCTGSY